MNKNNIFCSSIHGQDVKSGDRIEEVVRKKLSTSDIVIYILSNNFINSTYCTAELGAGWILQEKGAKIFMIKMPDIEIEDLKGFINSNYKFTQLNLKDLSALIDNLVEINELKTPSAVDVVNNIELLLVKTKLFIDKSVEEKNLTEAEKHKKTIESFHKTINLLNKYEKALISYLYFKEDRIEKLNPMDGLVSLLENKTYIVRLANNSFDFTFPYTLQPWVIKYIDQNDEFKKEIKSLKNLLLQKNHSAFETY